MKFNGAATRGPVLTKTAARFEVKALDEGKRTFRGLASTWDLDLGGDVIHQGAFDQTLADWRKSGKVLPLIDQHNYRSVRSVIGKMTDAAETDAGLETEFEIIEGPDGDEIMRRVKGGYIDSLSIGYEAVKWEMEQEEGRPAWEALRHLKELKLFEVSVVIWPMNPEAMIDPGSLKSFVAALRDGRVTKEQLHALLEAPSTEDADTPPAAVLYAKQEELSQRLLGLRLHRLGSRAVA